MLMSFFKGALLGSLFFTGIVSAQTKVDQANLDKGKRLYISNCIQCHNKDPNIKGSLGPEMVDAPLEVMTSKVMTGKYPEPLPKGFVPKRKSRAMRAIPKLKEDIPAIYAWVQSMKKIK
jgi:mono/diheme cytochrome c family protein